MNSSTAVWWAVLALNCGLPTTLSLADDSSSGKVTLVYSLLLSGEWNRVEKMLDADPNLVKYCDGRGNTVLHDAAENGRESAVRSFLSRGALMTVLNRDRRTPLDVAAYHNRLNVVEAFLDFGADINAIGVPAADAASPKFPLDSERLGTPLDWAAQGGSAEVVELLLSRGAKLDPKPAKESFSALHRAMLFGWDSRASKIRSEKEGYELFPANREIPGELPAVGNEKVIELLINAGGDLKNRNLNGHQPLHVAVNSGDAATVRVLITKYVDKLEINALNEVDYTPLDNARSTHKRSPKSEKAEWLEVIDLMKAHGALTSDELAPEPPRPGAP